LKRIAAAMALFFIASVPGIGAAATIRPLDQDGLNLRAGPGTGFQVVSTLAAGESLQVIGERDGWYKVRTATGQEAWAAGWVARVQFDDEQVEAFVDTDALNVRQEPSLTAPVLALLKQSERMRLLEIMPEWWRVRTAAGVEGWVFAAYVKRAPNAKPPVEQPPVEQPPVEQPPVEQPPVEQPPVEQPPVEQPPVVQPPVEQPPVEQPPVEQPPVEQPPAGPTADWPPPPPAPASVVPVLPVLPPAAVINTVGAKQVTAARNEIVYEGRDRDAFEWADTVEAGERLTYLDAAEGWVKVETARGERGWVLGDGVTMTEHNLLYEVTEGRWTVGLLATPEEAAASQATETYVERRAVKDADGLRLREQPEGTIITVLPQGEVLEIQALKMPWMQVQTEKGLTGWVHSEYTVPYTAPASAPTVKPVFRDGLKATLTADGSGILTLEVEAPGQEVGAPVAAGDFLHIPVATGQEAVTVLPIGSAGAKLLSVTDGAITLEMESLPGWQVTHPEPGKVSVVLRPAVTGATVRLLPDRTVYTFAVSGPLLPRTRVVGETVQVEFPGATPGWPAVPQGLLLDATDRGVTASVATRFPYTLRRTAGGFELHVLRPGLAGKTIVLDPGHGGPDAGAWNPATGIREKTINLHVALRLRALLESRGATVLMTRSTDTRPAPAAVIAQGPQDDVTHVDLSYRTRLANEMQADLFLSIHHNSGVGSGTETYYTSGTLNGDRSKQVARLLQAELPTGLGQVNRGAFDDLMYVTRTPDVPAALLEVAFINHRIEAELVGRADYQEQTARLIVRALEQFFAER
jgi:N-acetylmuramoyl-L-alanine amidase